MDLPTMHRADPIGDHAACQELLRAHLRRGGQYTLHPGELVWWMFHADPRVTRPELFLGDDSMVIIERDKREGTLFGDPQQLTRWLECRLGAGKVVVGGISLQAPAACQFLADSGYVCDSETMIVYTMSLDSTSASASVRHALPDGYTIRPLDPTNRAEVDSRADAARTSFASTMDPAMHRDRYRRFTRSPFYGQGRDLVAVDAVGAVASFAIWWGDSDLRLAQFEPVGTNPAYQGKGLAAAVLLAAFEEMRSAGMTRVRVCTTAPRTPARGLYTSVGFQQTDELSWWSRSITALPE